jgi:L-ascorbate metabolism protein UlaG (beta-lactamase superfamily)
MLSSAGRDKVVRGVLTLIFLALSLGDNFNDVFRISGGDASSVATRSLGIRDPSTRATLAENDKQGVDQWPENALTLENLGHATLLMNFFGVRVISDPTLFSRVGVAFDSIFTIGPRRMIAPVLSPDQLQTVRVVLITHAHMDHLDVPSLKALPKRAIVIACRGCGVLIRPLGFRDVRELDWGESTTADGLAISAMGARHWGKRFPPFGRDYGFNSYILAKGGHRTLLACDSADTDLFAALAANPPEVAAFSIAAYDPWIWNHANPEQVWKMFMQTGARYLVPIHWGTFRLSREPVDEPMHRLIVAAGADAGRIVMRQIGKSWTLPPDSRTAK